MDRTQDDRAFRMLVVLDEFTRRCLAILVARRLRSDDVVQCLTDLFVAHGPPEHLRSDNGREFVAASVRDWLDRIGVKILYIDRVVHNLPTNQCTLGADRIPSSTLTLAGAS